MSTFNGNIPQPGDELEDSQQDLLNNNLQLDTSFGVDHYNFSDGTANNGKHTEVTTPDQAAHVSTAADEPKLYAMRDAATPPNVPVIQYSRGGSDAVPTPVTNLQSPATPIILGASGNTTNVLDCAGITRAIFMLYAFDTTATNSRSTTLVFWSGSFKIVPLLSDSGAARLTATNTGDILQLKNSTGTPGFALNNVYWTLDMLRLEV